MLIAYELSMPSNNSWNGRWTGESQLYARVHSCRSKKLAEKILEQESYFYNFGDGWCASVSVKKVDSREAAKIRRKSSGFCGYDWMIDSIQARQKITTEKE